MLFTKKQWLFVFLAGLFITNAVTAELISNKLIEVPLSINLFGNKLGPFVTIVGILPWPVVFLLTDLLNEFYGYKAVRRLSWITAILISYCFIVVGLSMEIPAVEIEGSNLSDDASFNKVFGQAQMVIVGSICAFLVSQILDASLFMWIKSKTGERFIWLRSTGSTLISQLIDSYIVLYIGFVLPGTLSFTDFMEIAPTNYVLKIVIAILLTPLIYLGHYLIKRFVLR
ncbi:queuosine precursor transporter [Crocinitomicaceae bacterium]|nr:queuosine precursor transporter [Crocinitomicaceae bacterium]MDB4649797.1 queuosine precursor transporter [Crocinitomicaceae bacterium]